MRKKIFKNMLFTALITILLSCLLTTFVYYRDFQARMRTEVRTETAYLKSAMQLSGKDFLSGTLTTQNRITLISQDGTVLYDNLTSPDSMENHAQRPEIKAALSSGAGEITRMSDTIAKQTYYYAVRLEDGNVLRVAATTDTVFSGILGLLPWILGAAVLVAFITAMISNFLTKKIVKPINELDLDNPSENAYDEIAPLLTKISRQSEVISRQMRSLHEKQEEFTAITENMSEGFLVIDKTTDILSFNSSALRLLNADASEVSSRQSALTLNRSVSFRKVVDSSLTGKRAEQLLSQNGRCCRILANPVIRNREVMGAVVVILDVTEQEERENLRREFTANVSHELKTPLTSISGFAEIIKSGIVQPQDIPHFAGNIYEEAQRLIALVDDILNLSRLDEETIQPTREPVELKTLVGATLKRLAPAAKENDIHLSLVGKECTIDAVPVIVDEMLFNLCSNAIKYNRHGGTVTVELKCRPDGVSVSVKDTGIGIPAADVERVFERFYRVDKSHSKEIGGTGLGLSIVKHGAAFHGASVSLQSTENVGTTVTLFFPKDHTSHSETEISRSAPQ